MASGPRFLDVEIRIGVYAACAGTERAFVSLQQLRRLLEKFTLNQLAGAVEYSLDIDVIDPGGIRLIVEHRAEQSVDGIPDPLLIAHCYVFSAIFDSVEDR